MPQPPTPPSPAGDSGSATSFQPFRPIGPDDPTLLRDIVGVDEFRPGDRIGPYEIVGKLTQGGFAVVYQARHTEIFQPAAIKMIAPGRETPELIARFRHEHQALALMDHPNIVKVYDVGRTHDNRDYCVLELIRGKPITQYCDDKRLTIGERMRLFIKVCDAVHHAHLRGIIHRDIKPANVLVAEVPDARAGDPSSVIPKVIDFNIAKSLGGLQRDPNGQTQLSQFIGTLGYMSPEQAEGGLVNVDGRSDVYSLGVLLYELLTGVLPIPADAFFECFRQDVVRMLREQPPPKPSTRLSTLGNETDSVAKARGTDVARLTQELKGRLALIPLKALEPDLQDRYASAQDLAADVNSYLTGDILIAETHRFGAEFWKFIRRHRRLLPAAAAVSLALLLGLIVSLFFMRQAMFARNDATIAAYTANIAAADNYARQGRVDLAVESLENCPPNLRGWEWRRLSAASAMTRLFADQAPRTLSLRVEGDNLSGVRVTGPVRWRLADGSPVPTKAISQKAPSGESSQNWSVVGGDPSGRRLVSRHLSAAGTPHPQTLYLTDAATGDHGRALGELGTARADNAPLLAVFDERSDRVAVRAFPIGGDVINQRSILVYDLTKEAPPLILPDAHAWTFLPDGRLLLIGEDHRVYDLSRPDANPLIAPAPEAGRAALALAAADHVLIATDSEVRLYDASAWPMRPLHPTQPTQPILRGHCTAAAFIAGGSQIAVALDNIVITADARTGARLGSVRGNATPVTAIADSPQGELFLAEDAGDIRACKLSDVEKELDLPEVGSAQDCGRGFILLTPPRFAAAQVVWRLGAGPAWNLPPGVVGCPDPEHNQVLVLGPDNILTLHNLADGTRIRTIALPAMKLSEQGPINALPFGCKVCVHNGAAYVLRVSDGPAARLDKMDLRTATPIAGRDMDWGERKSSDWPFTTLNVLAGRVAVSHARTVEVFAEDLALSPRTFRLPNSVAAVAIEPGGKRIAAAGPQGHALVFDVATGATTALEGEKQRIECLAWRADPPRILAGANRRIRVWDAESATLRATLATDDRVQSLLETPDGATLVVQRDRVLEWRTR